MIIKIGPQSINEAWSNKSCFLYKWMAYLGTSTSIPLHGKVFLDGMIMHPATLKNGLSWVCGMHQQETGVDLASKFFNSQWNSASLEYAVKCPIHGGPTLKLTGLKPSATNGLVMPQHAF